MDISDIQEVKVDTHIFYEVTFADEDGYDAIKIIMTKENIVQLKDYFTQNLSYMAQQKKKDW